MPGQMTLKRQQQSINFQANSLVVSPQLGLSYQYRYLTLNLKGTLSAASALSQAKILPGDEWAVVKKLEIVINGGDVIQSFTGEQLANLQQFFFNRPRKLTDFSANGTTAFDSTIILPFWDEKGRVHFDTMLDSSRLTDLRVQTTWGDATSINGTNGATLTTSPIMTVTSRECFGLKGKKKGSVPKFSLARRYQKFNPSAIPSGLQYPFYLDVGNVYKGFWINTKDANGNDLADCIDRIRVVSGTHVYLDQGFRSLREEWQLRNWAMVDMTSLLAGTNEIPLGFSSGTNFRGWTYVDFRDDGYNTEAIDTYSLSELKILLDVNQTITTMMVMPDLVVPLRKKTA